ncbi:MAG: hypothetical protein KC454_10100 [Flavobacteriales bacterium]|nr:hypothetical protein [Flavobacteriales bacterium]
MKILLFTVVLLITNGLFSQINTTIAKNGFTSEILLDGAPKAKAGTYQFIYSTKRKFNYTSEQMDDMLKKIEQERSESSDLTIYLNDVVSIYIPSKNKIENKNFSLSFEMNN